jgi:hypothetical protein
MRDLYKLDKFGPKVKESAGVAPDLIAATRPARQDAAAVRGRLPDFVARLSEGAIY